MDYAPTVIAQVVNANGERKKGETRAVTTIASKSTYD